MQENYRLFGLTESASDEQIKERYSELKKKYNEERWLDGEAGNEAARMLEKIDAAYVEILNDRREKARDEKKSSSLLEEVSTAIKNGDTSLAQQKLDECDDRNAEWHYLQSVIFFKKSWMNESKKQLEIAMEMDPSNGKYKDAYDRLNSRMNYQQKSAYANEGDRAQSVNPEMEQMGGTGCSQMMECCYTYLCINCMFNLCCNCR